MESGTTATSALGKLWPRGYNPLWPYQSKGLPTPGTRRSRGSSGVVLGGSVVVLVVVLDQAWANYETAKYIVFLQNTPAAAAPG